MSILPGMGKRRVLYFIYLLLCNLIWIVPLKRIHKCWIFTTFNGYCISFIVESVSLLLLYLYLFLCVFSVLPIPLVWIWKFTDFSLWQYRPELIIVSAGYDAALGCFEVRRRPLRLHVVDQSSERQTTAFPLLSGRNGGDPGLLRPPDVVADGAGRRQVGCRFGGKSLSSLLWHQPCFILVFYPHAILILSAMAFPRKNSYSNIS